MAMGYYCYAEGIECKYADSCGNCIDDIAEDFGLCEMHGDEMPPKELGTEARKAWAMAYLSNHGGVG